jgi:two-component system, cell cycle sensor histidine kinase and response regulator CckA
MSMAESGSREPRVSIERASIVALHAEVRSLAERDSSIDELLQASAGAFIRHLSLDRVEIWMLDSTGTWVPAAIERTPSRILGESPDPLGGAAALEVVEAGRFLFVRNASGLTGSSSPSLGPVAYIGCPVVVEGRVAAVLQIFHHTPPSGSMRRAIDVLTDVLARGIRVRRAEGAQHTRDVASLKAIRMEAMGRLAGHVAHDFNNILTAIIGYGELALQQLDDELPARADVIEMVSAARRASALTQKLIAFSRPHAAGRRIVDLNQVLLDSECRLRRGMGSGVELRLVVATSPLWVGADPRRLEELIVNLVTNACDAMPEGGRLTIEASVGDRGDALGDPARERENPEDTRRRRPPSPAGRMTLTVTDTGKGMSAEVQARLFEPFFTTKPKDERGGFGLATVYAIAHGIGGSVTIDTAPGRGSTFCVLLPAASAEAQAEPAERVGRVHSRTSAPRAFHPARPWPVSHVETVLLVEDEDMVRRIAAQVLATDGYMVLEASSPTEGLELAASHPGGIDLLISDLVLPGMDGRDLAAVVLARRPETRVLFMSGYLRSDDGDHPTLDRAAFLQKPFRPDELVDKVREALENGESAAA